jgi:hypothetical protein
MRQGSQAAGDGGRLLTDAVDVIHRVISEEDWAGSGQLRHVLFAMRVAGWDTDFSTLMCVSGAAFMFHYEPQVWQVAYGLPQGWSTRLTEATGFGYKEVAHSGVDDAWRAVVESVDSGRVLGAEWMECVTFAGYEDASEPEGRKVFAIDRIFEWPGAWWDWARFSKWYDEWPRRFRWMARHSGRVASIPPRDSALAALRKIPFYARQERPPQNLPQARYGLAGIAAYADAVADPSKPKDYLAGPWHGCHAIICQWAARRHAASYLRKVCGLFPDEARRLLVRAVEGYEAAHAAWQEYHRHLGNDSPTANWDSPENRLAGAAAIRRALAHETTAMENVQGALATMG